MSAASRYGVGAIHTTIALLKQCCKCNIGYIIADRPATTSSFSVQTTIGLGLR